MNNKITVEGDYIIEDDSGKDIVKFKEDFILNGAIENIGEARAVIKRLITPRLKKKNPGTRHVKTCQVVSMTPCMEKAEQVELSKLWLEAINMSCVPDAIGEYRDEESIKASLERAIAKKKARDARPSKAGNGAESL